MKWKAKFMVDPGDGLVAASEFEHESDDIGQVACDIFNGEVEGIPSEAFVVSLEVFPS